MAQVMGHAFNAHRTSSARLVQRTMFPRPQLLLQPRRILLRRLSCSPWRREAQYRERSREQHQGHSKDKEPFLRRLKKALRETKVEWYQIPIGLGIGFVGLLHLYHVRERDRTKEEGLGYSGIEDGGDNPGLPPKKNEARIRPSGPWHIQAMSILPLKALSRVWGRFNEHDIPKPLRLPGFKLYSKIFGVDLSEVSESDLRQYPNLSAFFYRTLKPGCRPLDSDPDALLSPADGRVLQFGTIEQGKVEQVKGITYRLDALLGSIDVGTSPNPSAPSNVFGRGESELDKDVTRVTQGNEDRIGEDEEFARVNGIAYTLPDLISGAAQEDPSSSGTQTDVSMEPAPSSEARVTADLELSRASAPWYSRFTSQNKTALYYAVIYLAPGDYHRFHSPANWVVERRRHFAGELYSVSPYLQRLLPGLFTINERVVLLGRWRWGFFSFIPVGATNVGSIKVNFDRELKTNSLTADTAAKKAAKGAAKRGETQPGYAEASYEAASRVLRGHALQRGEEMGGFQLGSSIVLVFEGPAGGPDAGWRWVVEKGQRIKVGEALGRLEKE